MPVSELRVEKQRGMNTAFDITADLDTPVSAYLKLAPFQPRFLLESVEGGDRLGRYSFIGFGAALEVRLTAHELRINGSHVPAPASNHELLAALRGALERAPRPQPTIAGLPFQGGLVGATGFAMHHRFESLNGTHPAGPIPDAVYLAPESVLAFDHLTRRVALLHAGPEDERRSLRREVIDALRGPVPLRRSVTQHSEPCRSLGVRQFEAAVGRVKEYITSGDVYQLVLSVCFSGSCDVAPFEVYRALRLLNPSPYLFFCEFGDLAVVGSSPEALVRLQGRQASLRPIAGTRPRGTTEEGDRALAQELLDDPKENAEHIMLVDLARNDLGRVAVPGSVAVDPYRIVERYSHVMHMVSGVRYFGHHGTMDQAIAIRTLVFNEGTYAYQAGAGIVADSVPERELAEVMAKSAALEAALVLAEEGL